MISLIKGPSPAWLLANQARATAAYQLAPDQNKPSPWRSTEVVTALRSESRNKCMYCEGIIDDVAYSAVEHIRPKSKFPELILHWDNLGLACTRCNTNKREYWTYNPDHILVNPYVDRVVDHLVFIGPLIAAADGSQRGINTIRRLKFSDRTDLVISKMRRIEDLEVRILLWLREIDDATRELLAEDIRAVLGPDREFSATLISYASHRGFPV